MVLTRSAADAGEAEERRREAERAQAERTQREAIEAERRRRVSLNPPDSPFVTEETEGASSRPRGEQTTERALSPARSVRSHRSNASIAARQYAIELEHEEQMVTLKMRQLELEANLLKKKRELRLAALQSEEQDGQSVQGEEAVAEHHRRVDSWLRANPVTPRGEGGTTKLRSDERQLRFELRGRSPTPTRSRSNLETLAEAVERATRPKVKCVDLPFFSGNPTEWLIFKASYTDSTKIYNIAPIENLQRLRSCLKGEAREAVATLLYTSTDPAAIMKTLEQSYGRPEDIIDRAFDEIRKLQRPGPSASDLNKFAIKIQNVVSALKCIGKDGYLHNPLLARDALDKLSPHVKARWCDYASEQDGTTEPEIVVLSRFLMREADRAMKFNYTSTSSATTTSSTSVRAKPTNTGAVKKKPAVYNVVDEELRTQCSNCGGAHSLPDCPAYKAMTVERRWDLVREKKLCFKCIASKHRRLGCKAQSCGVSKCRRPHHATLHEEEDSKSASSSETVLSVATPSTKANAVLLKMCPVTVVGPRGEIRTHALLDEGATISLIDEELARCIGARGTAHPLSMQGVNTSQRECSSKRVDVQLRTTNSELLPLRAHTIANMKLLRQSIPSALLEFEHLQDLPSSDVCYEDTRPGVLVGTDHWEYIVSRELRVGEPNEPAASRTQLGWVIHGTAPRTIVSKSNCVLHVFSPEHEDTIEHREQDLHALVEEHFGIDALGVAHKPRVSDADQRATRIVEATIKKIERGYEVGLPWKQDDLHLPPSYNAALRRLKKIEQKMDAAPDFAAEYTKQIENLLLKGYAEPCDGTEEASPVRWYLPHFAVQNINKPGKHRLVFDAAARSYGVSLNDHLLEGPDLLVSLQGILFRFREKSVAVTADIAEMFLQVKIRKADQPAQMFLWRGNDRSKPPAEFKMTSMIFGAASSPFMAHYVRNHNAAMYSASHPLAFEAITTSHYMDDLVASYDDPDEAYRAVGEMQAVHAAAGFTLRSWNASDSDILRDVPTELRATKTTQLGTSQPDKILGLYWNADQDELGFNTSMNRVPADVRMQRRAPSKREALSAVMSIYDPLGLLSHYTIRAKIVLQSLWRLKIAWDEQIPNEENELFAAWLRHLPELADLRLERRYNLCSEDIELHVLCDASEQAYAAVAYWRVTSSSGATELSLIAGKSKVAPKRTQTIPRLELQAAVIAARLAATIKNEHRVNIKRTIYWTDSMTVIQWIRHDQRRYTPFVAHRLGEISELTAKEDWRWVPTGENVADDATRLTDAPIAVTNRWFQGPDFLRLPGEQWPAERAAAEGEDSEVLLHVTEADDLSDRWLPDPARFSKYEVLVRAAARALAFVDMCRRRATHLEHRHIEEAERALLRRAQRDSFSDEIQRLTKSRPIPKSSRLYRLDPVLEDGVLRVRGRIGAATAPIEMKRPIILDGRHPTTRLLVLREHCTAGHANRERVTNDLRQRYWVIHLRPTVRAIEKNCALCKVRKNRPRPPATGDLPRARVEPYQRPFSCCGTDYFGPMMVKIGRRREKRWGSLYTCLTTRAVHIEVVPSLSTSSAIMALRRMAARRGWPRLIYSDNATNFRGADKELRDAYTEWAPALREEGLRHRAEWRFIPPGAPNQGGAWERLVRSVKTALAATLNEQVPSEEVLITLLAEAEHSVNSRPLTHVSVSPDDPEALTPNHFLLGSSSGLPSTGPCETADLRTWRASQALADHFWRRWVREYLPQLVSRGEPQNTARPLQAGDVVIIIDHTLPRNVWPMGCVERVYAGPDGGIRVADVRTRTGTFKRPVSKLAVLVKHEEEAARATPGGGCCGQRQPTGARESGDAP